MIDVIHTDDTAVNPLVTLMDVRPYSEMLILIPERFGIENHRQEPCFRSNTDTKGKYVSIKKIEEEGYDAVVYLGPTHGVNLDIRIGEGLTEPKVSFLNEGSNKQMKIHLMTLDVFLGEEL